MDKKTIDQKIEIGVHGKYLVAKIKAKDGSYREIATIGREVADHKEDFDAWIDIVARHFCRVIKKSAEELGGSLKIDSVVRVDADKMHELN